MPVLDSASSEMTENEGEKDATKGPHPYSNRGLLVNVLTSKAWGCNIVGNIYRKCIAAQTVHCILTTN